MIAIIPERVIGMPRNTDRHRPESPIITDLKKTFAVFGLMSIRRRFAWY